MKAPAVKRTKIQRAHTVLERVASRVAHWEGKARSSVRADIEHRKAITLLDLLAVAYGRALAKGCRVKQARARGGKS